MRREFPSFGGTETNCTPFGGDNKFWRSHRDAVIVFQWNKKSKIRSKSGWGAGVRTWFWIDIQS